MFTVYAGVMASDVMLQVCFGLIMDIGTKPDTETTSNNAIRV